MQDGKSIDFVHRPEAKAMTKTASWENNVYLSTSGKHGSLCKKYQLFSLVPEEPWAGWCLFSPSLFLYQLTSRAVLVETKGAERLLKHKDKSCDSSCFLVAQPSKTKVYADQDECLKHSSCPTSSWTVHSNFGKVHSAASLWPKHSLYCSQYSEEHPWFWQCTQLVHILITTYRPLQCWSVYSLFIAGSCINWDINGKVCGTKSCLLWFAKLQNSFTFLIFFLFLFLKCSGLPKAALHYSMC